MKLILKFGLAALLFAFLAVPSLAEKHQSGAVRSPESGKAPQAKQSGVKDSHDRYAPSPAREGTKTQTSKPALGDIKGESTDDKHKDWIKMQKGSQQY